MNPPRLLGEGRSFYHCVSRVVDRRFIFENQDKAVFRRIQRLLERFTGVRAVTYCVMSNHFHLLLDVPDRKELAPLGLEELLELLPELHDPVAAEGVRQEIERALASERAEQHNEEWRREQAETEGNAAVETEAHDLAESASGRDSDAPPGSPEGGAFWDGASVTGVAGILERYERRRGDLSTFMKMLKLRLTFYMNKRLDRVGTLWESRFKSVLVEGDETALMAVAAYIDLNPLRAGMVERPEDYPWCGYGEAASKGRGATLARRGLGSILREALGHRGQDAEGCREDWRRTLSRYRLFLYERGEERAGDPATGSGARTGIAAAEVAAEVAAARDEDEPEFRRLASVVGGLCRGRVRYFTDGGIFGRAEFVESVFAREKAKGRFGRKRRKGARRLRGADWGPLRILRNLKKCVFGE